MVAKSAHDGCADAMVGPEINRTIKATTNISPFSIFMKHLLNFDLPPCRDQKLNHLLFRVIFATGKEKAKEISLSAAFTTSIFHLNKSNLSP
jgi:hypothetical protein